MGGVREGRKNWAGAMGGRERGGERGGGRKEKKRKGTREGEDFNNILFTNCCHTCAISHLLSLSYFCTIDS